MTNRPGTKKTKTTFWPRFRARSGSRAHAGNSLPNAFLDIVDPSPHLFSPFAFINPSSPVVDSCQIVPVSGRKCQLAGRPGPRLRFYDRLSPPIGSVTHTLYGQTPLGLTAPDLARPYFNTNPKTCPPLNSMSTLDVFLPL